MSKFSTYLKRLIADSGESISSLARTIGAERTSIHKALADERILSYKQFKHSHAILIFPLMNEKIFFSYMISFFKARKRTTTGRPSAVC